MGDFGRPETASPGQVVARPVDGELGPGPFVGRRAELARLCGAVEAAFAGASAAVWLVGESGAGKTRLVREIASYARLRGACVEWLEAPDLASRAAIARASGRAAELLIADGIDSAAAGAAAVTAAAVSRLVAAEGVRRLLLGTSRHAPSGPLATVLGERSTGIVVLGGLDPAALARLLGALSGEALDPEVVAGVVRSTRGNPGRARAWLAGRARSPVPDGRRLAQARRRVNQP